MESLYLGSAWRYNVEFLEIGRAHAIAKYQAGWDERAENSEESMTEDSTNIDSISESDESANGDEDHRCDSDEEDREEAKTAANLSNENPDLAEMLERLFGLVIAFSTEEVVDGRPASTLLVGILGFTTDSTGFLPARSYTSNLAALIFTQRLLFLEYALPARAYISLGITQRPRTDQVARLQDVRQKYTVLGSQCPLEELFSLLAYGKAISSSETPPFLLRWSDDGVLSQSRVSVALIELA
ncbi:unnamed protein product [Fusarium graminearum]|uniref:Uncharacterized protein n=1 Tax=Gibberella zeae TaxID=5518 RepID=A0A9N8WZC6_GIBZA|nr:unnamed protein product [Fusarium graminearum]